MLIKVSSRENASHGQTFLLKYRYNIPQCQTFQNLHMQCTMTVYKKLAAVIIIIITRKRIRYALEKTHQLPFDACNKDI